MRQAGLLEHIDPQVWTIPWNVHSQANHHGHSAFTSLAPYVFKVAISNHRLVSLTDRTVTFTYRKVGSARLRTAHLDVMEFLRRFLQHVLPDGFMKVRHFGFLHASCALPLATIRLMIVQGHPSEGQPPPRTPPPPRAARCPTCGAPMRVVDKLMKPFMTWCLRCPGDAGSFRTLSRNVSVLLLSVLERLSSASRNALWITISITFTVEHYVFSIARLAFSALYEKVKTRHHSCCASAAGRC